MSEVRGLNWGSAASAGADLYSLNEPGDLSQRLSHDDNTINILLSIISTIIIIIIIQSINHLFESGNMAHNIHTYTHTLNIYDGL